MIQKIDFFIKSTLESGLDGFFWSWTTFLIEIRNLNETNQSDDIPSAITIDNIRMIVIIYLSGMILATIIFGFEILLYRFKKWNEQRIDSVALFPFTN